MKKCGSKDIRVGARIYAPATGATGYFQALENNMLIIAWDQGTSTYLPLDFDNPNDVIRIIEWFDCCNLVLLALPVLFYREAVAKHYGYNVFCGQLGIKN